MLSRFPSLSLGAEPLCFRVKVSVALVTSSSLSVIFLCFRVPVSVALFPVRVWVVSVPSLTLGARCLTLSLSCFGSELESRFVSVPSSSLGVQPPHGFGFESRCLAKTQLQSILELKSPA